MSLEPADQEPDPRFTLANERTFLAWIRTALALVAAGVGVVALVPPAVLPGLRNFLALGLVATGVLLSATSHRHWARNERALRAGTSLPRSRLLPVVAAAVGVITALVLAGLAAGALW